MHQSNEEKRREHALRNERLSLFLNQENTHPDWVITTAFYSALQFVKYKAFPMSEDARKFDTFDDYFGYQKSYQRNQYGIPLTSHQCLRDLIKRKFNKISAEYEILFGSCYNARYVDYDVRPEDVQLALKCLAAIKKFCNTEKPKKRPKRKRIKK